MKNQVNVSQTTTKTSNQKFLPLKWKVVGGVVSAITRITMINGHAVVVITKDVVSVKTF